MLKFLCGYICNDGDEEEGPIEYGDDTLFISYDKHYTNKFRVEDYNDKCIYDKHLCEDDECIICLEYFDDKIAVLDCGHYYHIECISEWFKKNDSCDTRPTCPICRKNIDSILD